MGNESGRNNEQIDPAAAIRNGKEIILQAFNWESHKHDWWRNLEQKVPDIAKSGFTSAWLPPPTHSFAPEVIYKTEIYQDERAVTSCTGGKGNKSTGGNFNGVPNIDHTQDFVRKDLKDWLRWLRNTVGFQDFRFDFARGYSPKYVKEYIEGAMPIFSVGEYWDSCNYKGTYLDYNQDSHRQRIIDWIDGTGQLSAAFDFTKKGILQQAVKGELWRLRDSQGKPPGVMGLWPSRAVTFLDNHDTGSTQAHWPFPSDHIMEGYAYIITHPGIPSVFYDHFFDWGSSIHDQIVKLIDIRRNQGINSRSAINILEAQPNLYAASIGDKIAMKIGDGSWCPSGEEWKLAISGHRYAIWDKY